MAISVNTDLVLGVLNAASPKNVAAANAKLQSASSFEVAAAGDKFTAELLASKTKQAPPSDLSDLRSEFTKPNQTEAHKKFEAMVLHQFVQHMLPSDTSVIFGEGTSGEIWKGMLAQQIGDAIAQGGGIGIADKMLAQTVQNKTPVGLPADTAASIVNERQRELLDSLNDK